MGGININQCCLRTPDGVFAIKKERKNMGNQIMKPMTVARHEFVSALTDLVNNSQLPAFILEPVLKDVYLDIKLIAQRQLEADLKQYAASQKKAGGT